MAIVSDAPRRIACDSKSDESLRRLIALHTITNVTSCNTMTTQRYSVERAEAFCTCWEWLPNSDDPL